MRRPLVSLSVAALLLASSFTTGRAQATLYVSPDVPADPDGPATYLPWQVVAHDHASPVPYALELTLPGSPAIDAIEKMDLKGNWLFSLEAPNDLGGALAAPAEPRDVIRGDVLNAVYGLFFDGSCVTGVVPPGSDIDALYLDHGDAGELVLSFDVPTTIAGTTYQPGELVLYKPSGLPPCGWTVAGSVIDFGLTLGTYLPSSANLIGADRDGADWILAFDVPTDLGPPGVMTYTPGQVVLSDGLVTGLFDDLQTEGIPGWSIRARVDALACQANPGTIYDPTVLPVGLLLGKAVSPDITLYWAGGSCSSGAVDYGIYEGTLANVHNGVYDHVRKDCSDAPPFLQETVTPLNTSTYYLVVPQNGKVEGSYCTDSLGAQRPQPALLAQRCVADRVITACP